jgi:hypothetical protein
MINVRRFPKGAPRPGFLQGSPFVETNLAKSSSGRMPRVRPVTADDLQTAIARLAEIQGELAAVAERMRRERHKHLSVTGWGKFDRAMELLKQFSAHTEFAMKTAPGRE